MSSANAGNSVKLASYNIQIGLGMDKKYDLGRTAEAIRKFGAETIVLNEVDVGTDRSQGDDQPAILARKLGLNYLFGRASDRPGGVYGNVVMSVHELEQLDLIDLEADGHESRSALVVKVKAPRPYYIIAAHLAFQQLPEIEAVRIRNMEFLAEYLKRKQLSPAVLCGDLNSAGDSPVIRKAQEVGFQIVDDLSGKALSWPADQPRILLDYFCLYPADAGTVKEFKVVDERMASDHRPVYAEIIFR
jgi:endonuclease/exonuclease/phosphatase family metal-dependent hydrolase